MTAEIVFLHVQTSNLISMESIIITQSQQAASGRVESLVEIADRYRRLYEDTSGRLEAAIGALAVSHFNTLQATQLLGIMANAYFDLSRQYREKQEKEIAELEAYHKAVMEKATKVMEKATKALEGHPIV